MNIHLLSRRGALGLLAAGAGASAWPVGKALAQTAPGTSQRDWYSMVQQHHGLLAKAFKVLLAPDNDSFEKRRLQLRNLDQLMGAHSFAEEMVLYPALAHAGLAQDAERFYVVEGRLKVMRARLEDASRAGRGWREPAHALQEALLEHAKEEEADEFAKLREKLSAQENRRLGSEYAWRFSSVIPARRR